MASGEAAEAIHHALLGDALWRATELGAFVLDEHGRYVAVNDCACALAGLEREEIVGETIGSSNPHLAVEYATTLRERRAGGRTHVDRKDGRRVNVGYRVTSTRLGAVPYLLVVCWHEDSPPADPRQSRDVG